MSRIGNKPIPIPAGVTVTVSPDNVVTVKGKSEQLVQRLDPDLKVEITDGEALVRRPTDQKRHKSLHGLYRALIANMIKGVSEGYAVVMRVVGVGWKAEAKGQLLELTLGFSHPIFMIFPPEIRVNTETRKGEAPEIILKSADKQLLGHFAAKIRSLRKPEPYKGKGILFKGEQIRRKAGKQAAKA